MHENYQKLLARLNDVTQLGLANGLLGWDQQVNMPHKGAPARGAQMAVLARLNHELFTSPETGELIEAAAAELKDAPFESDEASMVRVARRDYELATKLPSSLVAEMAQTTAEAHPIWAEARAKSDFKHFQPMLERIIGLMQQAADHLGYTEHPYDALLGQFEPGVTASMVKTLFDGHKPALVELIAAIGKHADRVSDAVLHQPFDVEAQRKFSTFIAEKIGFDFERGRLDVAVHPFASGLTRNDVRLTTRFDPNFFSTALFGVMHEAGHGMYEQGIGENVDGTALGGGATLSIHESQSRLWENIVGRSKGFWSWALPLAQQHFPQLNGVDLDTFYRAINKVQPSLIRVEADEATYNLHIMLRFELEMDVLVGAVKVADLPKVWNERFEAYLGITPPNDAQGVLQDVHWSSGLFGYFPTYALGNLLSVQYYNQALKDHPEIPDEIAQGKFDTLLRWLNTNIHQHGRKFTADELTRQVTGSPMQYDAYLTYLQTKYGEIYGL